MDYYRTVALVAKIPLLAFNGKYPLLRGSALILL